jgi:hypothetical protein
MLYKNKFLSIAKINLMKHKYSLCEKCNVCILKQAVHAVTTGL